MRVGPSRSTTRGTTARGSSLAICRNWRKAADRAASVPWRPPMASMKEQEMTDVLPAQLDMDTITRAYARWAPVYDLVFGAVFERGRRAAIEAAERIGGRILEVGVGTGISLPDYSRANRICGVDISEAMLKKARERVQESKLEHVEALDVMDAERLNFQDESFDVVVAQYVVTAVPNPEAALD